MSFSQKQSFPEKAWFSCSPQELQFPQENVEILGKYSQINMEIFNGICHEGGGVPRAINVFLNCF